MKWNLDRHDIVILGYTAFMGVLTVITVVDLVW